MAFLRLLGTALLTLCVGLSLACRSTISAAESDSGKEAGKISFARQILPILSDKCFACHGPDTADEGLVRLDSFDAATDDLGGYRAIDPADVEQSELLARIFSEDDPMPPRDAEKQLSREQAELLAAWVRQGGQYEKHWAYVPPVKVAYGAQAGAPPLEPNEAIDFFIRRKLKTRNVELAEAADRATLARRVSLVLTGLPPEIEQLDQFLSDETEGAYQRFVEQLLSSPRFGEHQARYWLDAVRYGDTHGLHLDNRRGIYPYRDWVVRAFNRNLPLDDFITWQLAGDLLPAPTLEQLTATGFVRLNPSTGEGGAIADEFQAKNNFDRTETLGTVLLGMSLVCARCHTHKYDPIPQREYYQLMAFFNSTAEPPLDGNSYTYGDTAKVPRNQDQWDRWEQVTADKRSLLQQTEVNVGDGPLWRSLVALGQQRLEQAAEKAAQQVTDVSGTDPKGAEQQEQKTAQLDLEPWAELVRASAWSNLPARSRLRIIADAETNFEEAERNKAREILEFESEAQKTFTTTLVARDLPKPRPTRVLRRGEYDMPVGDPVQPDVIGVLGAMREEAPRNRLGLAQWLTASQNPLVSRVLVNRLWQRVFGSGLVRTPEDFGLQGEQPTHPELLDWLAVELRESGWDMKHTLRLMVTSETFKQASAWRSEVNDPENRLWARGPSFRLDAEVIRDVGLWASGLLDPQLGGEGVKPYQPDGMWRALAHPASNTKKYVQDSGPLLYRRSLYIYWKRTSPHPMMTLFDAPDRESSCVRRSRTNTSLQSLGLFNETQRIEMGRKLAERLLKEASDDGQRLDMLFKLLASRGANDLERTTCLNLLDQLRERYVDNTDDAIALLAVGETQQDPKLNPTEVAAWAQVCVTVMASDVALTLY